MELLEILQYMGLLCACKNMYLGTSGTETPLSTAFVIDKKEKKIMGEAAFSRLFVSEPPA